MHWCFKIWTARLSLRLDTIHDISHEALPLGTLGEPRSYVIRSQGTTLGAKRANRVACQRHYLLKLSSVRKLLFVPALFLAWFTEMAEFTHNAVLAAFIVDERARLAATGRMTCR